MGSRAWCGAARPISPCRHNHTRSWVLGTWRLVRGPLLVGYSIPNAGWKEFQAPDPSVQGSQDLLGWEGGRDSGAPSPPAERASGPA